MASQNTLPNGALGPGHKDEVPWQNNSSVRHADPDKGITDETLLEWRKMVSGQVYNPADPYLMAERIRVGAILHKINDPSLAWDFPTTQKLIQEACGIQHDPSFFIVMPPIFFQYGNINFEDSVLISPEAHILDVCPIHIGRGTMIAARATIVSGGHHPVPELRWSTTPEGEIRGSADGAPIYIGRDCWIGANVTITQGVRIGDGSVIGAGSVVNKDIPNRCVATGNPAKIVKWLEEGESMEEYVERFRDGTNGGKMGRMADGIPPPASRQQDAERWSRGEGRVWVSEKYGKTGE